MTRLRRLRLALVPVLVALGLLGMSILIDQAPERYVNVVRLMNGFAIVAFLAWVIQRMLRYEHRLDHHEAQMLAVVERGQLQRAKELESLSRQQAHLAADLARERDVKSAEHSELSAKVDVLVEKTKESPS